MAKKNKARLKNKKVVPIVYPTKILPNHLLEDHILPRLSSLKTLISFKCASKFWYSISSSPDFKKYLLNQLSPSLQLLFLTNLPTTRFFQLSYDEFNDLKDPVVIDKNPDYRLNGGYVDLVGSANGLVCVNNVHYCNKIGGILDNNYDRRYSDFYICNPATRQYNKINNPESQEVAYRKDFWFGYVPSIDDYKIVAAFYNYKSRTSEFYVFSLSTGRWKRMEELDKLHSSIYYNPSSRYFLDINSKVIDNILHWSFRKISDDYGRIPMPPVFGLDLVNEELREFPPLEHWFRGYYDKSIHFLEISGCLAMYCYEERNYGFESSDSWILKQSGGSNSWVRLCSFDNRMEFCHVTNTGKYVVWKYAKEDSNDSEREFMIINPREYWDTSFFVVNVPINTVAVDYVESVTSPLEHSIPSS